MPGMSTSLSTLRPGRIAQWHAQTAGGKRSCVQRVQQALHLSRQEAAEHVFTAWHEEMALEAARHADALACAGLSAGPLAGVPVSVKDLFDVAGEPTPAGSVLRRTDAPAAADAPVVARLRAAGAALIGRTHMTEFAFSGVGINPHLGTPRNPCDTTTARIPGGSSSGAAVSVALGIAVAALRTVSDRADDTAHLDFGRFVAEVAAEFTRDIVRAALARGLA